MLWTFLKSKNICVISYVTSIPIATTPLCCITNSLHGLIIPVPLQDQLEFKPFTSSPNIKRKGFYNCSLQQSSYSLPPEFDENMLRPPYEKKFDYLDIEHLVKIFNNNVLNSLLIELCFKKKSAVIF